MGLVEALGIEAGNAPRIATAFGAGMACCGEICGALVGAGMVLGLQYGRESAEDLAAKSATYARSQQLVAAFRKEFGSVRCIELTGCDMLTPEGLARSQELDLHGSVCPKFVAFAAEVAEGLLRGE
jgi:C_GCAxxG_C_C family probable redox protein